MQKAAKMVYYSVEKMVESMVAKKAAKKAVQLDLRSVER